MRSICCYLIMFIVFPSFSQSSIEFNYNDVYIGRNINVSWKKTISNYTFSAGLTYHINNIEKAPIGTLIKKSALAQNYGERFGIQLGFEYFFFKNSYCRVGLFYNNQTSLISQIHKMYYAYDTLVSNPQSEFDYLYTKSERIYGPVFTCDNVIGLTLKNNLTDNFYLTTKAGLGLFFSYICQVANFFTN